MILSGIFRKTKVFELGTFCNASPIKKLIAFEMFRSFDTKHY